jgi:hypothetical protein
MITDAVRENVLGGFVLMNTISDSWIRELMSVGMNRVEEHLAVEQERRQRRMAQLALIGAAGLLLVSLLGLAGSWYLDPASFPAEAFAFWR